MSAKKHALTTVEQFLSSVTKSAEANSEPGSKGGATTHPSKDVTDGTQSAKTGPRAAENAKDVKKDQGAPAVEGEEAKIAAGDSGGTASSDQLQIGTKKAPTGEDPKVETASAKAGKNDPGSAHPARTDNKELNGGKYAEDMSLDQLAMLLKEAGDDLTAAITAEITGGEKRAAYAAPASAAQAPAVAEHAGWALAGMADGTIDKAAVDATVQETIAQIIKVAEEDATNVASYLHAYVAQKRADAPPMMPPGMGAGGPPPGAGLPPELAAGGGMPPGMGAGGPPPGAGGGGEEAEAEALLAELAKMGITPEQLMQLLQEMEAGGGAGGPAAGGAPPPGGAGAGAPGGMEVAAADKGTKTAAMIEYVREIVSRSRAKEAKTRAA